MGAHEQDERPASEILTIEELALYLKVAKSTLYKLAQEGKLPAQKVGRHWRFRKEAIDRWLGHSRAASDAERTGNH
jgi:excisionase family DNA binding protein